MHNRCERISNDIVQQRDIRSKCNLLCKCKSQTVFLWFALLCTRFFLLLILNLNKMRLTGSDKTHSIWLPVCALRWATKALKKSTRTKHIRIATRNYPMEFLVFKMYNGNRVNAKLNVCIESEHTRTTATECSIFKALETAIKAKSSHNMCMCLL